MTATLRHFGVITLTLIIGLTSLITATPAFAQESETETTSNISIAGQLIELSSTSVPTTIIVRENPAGEFKDHTIDITEKTRFGFGQNDVTSMNDWIPGDSIRLQGILNENTDVVTANAIVNQTMLGFRGLNGWITEINETTNTMTVQWDGQEHIVNVTNRTHMVVPPLNPATITDFEIEDRVRLRLFNDDDATIDNEARIILILRRGPHIYNLARTRGFRAELTEIDTENNEMNVLLTRNKHLADGDVNNLIGVEGEEITVSWNDHTKFVRKYNGSASEDELSVGDQLFIVGRVNDDGTVSARLIKDTSIHAKNIAHHLGEVVSFDTSLNTIEVIGLRNEGEWTVNYTEDTEFIIGREVSNEEALAEGLVLRIRGVANTQLHTLEAKKIAITNHAANEKQLERRPARLHQIHAEVKEFEAKKALIQVQII